MIAKLQLYVAGRHASSLVTCVGQIYPAVVPSLVCGYAASAICHYDKSLYVNIKREYPLLFQCMWIHLGTQKKKQDRNNIKKYRPSDLNLVIEQSYPFIRSLFL